MSHKWMGNVLIDGFFHPDYAEMNAINIEKLLRSIYHVQAERSYYLNLVESVDIWEITRYFQRQVNETITEKNKQTETMEELLKEVVTSLKKWIMIERPSPLILYGPWRLYASQQYSRP